MEWSIWRRRSVLYKRLIQRDDFEKYQFPIPAGELFLNKRNRFIQEELRRRHPCFSSNFSYDSKIVFSGKKLSAIVLVMKKTKLAEIFSERKINLFGFKADGIKFYRWFVNRHLYLFVLPLLILSVWFFFVFRQNLIKEKNEQISIDKVLGDEDKAATGMSIDFETEVPEMVENENALCVSISDFFEILRKENGKIVFFDYVNGEFGEKFCAEVKSVFPEKLNGIFENTEISSVNYEDKSPVYTITAFDRKEKKSNQKIEEKEVKNEVDDFQILIRDVLMSNNANLKEEKKLSDESTFYVKFYFPKKNDVLNAISKKITELNLKIKKIILRPESNQGYSVELTVEKTREMSGFTDLESINKNLDLFFMNSSETQEMANAKKSEINVKNREENKLENENKIRKEKIGEVSGGNGTKTVFYREQNGKIIRQIEKMIEKKEKN